MTLMRLKFGSGTRKMSSLHDTNDAKIAKGTKGFTLIELTVVLAVIVTLALILTPSMINFINDSRTARARSDTQTISAAVIQFYRDNGFFPQWNTANAGGPGVVKVDLLVSAGNVPTIAAANLWTTGTTDLLDDQLLTNAPTYTVRTATNTFGWNGPYLSSGITADSWNNRYMINVGLIDTTQGTQTSLGATKSTVWTISSGANGQIETPHAQAITGAPSTTGDDIGFRLQ